MTNPGGRKQGAAYLLYPKGDPRRMTKLGKPRYRMVDPTRFLPSSLTRPSSCGPIRSVRSSNRCSGRSAQAGPQREVRPVVAGQVLRPPGIPPGPYDDTIIVHHSLNENLGIYKLKDLVCEWFEIPWKKRAAFYPNLGEMASTTMASITSPDTWLRTADTAGCLPEVLPTSGQAWSARHLQV